MYNLSSKIGIKEAGIVETSIRALPNTIAGGAIGTGIGHFMPPVFGGPNAKYIFGGLGSAMGAASTFERQKEKDRVKRMYRDKGVYVSDIDAERMLSNSFAMPNHAETQNINY